ncbi:hypothetical protein [Terricaulis sp.]|uniref:hypothetical protein n=1 Tax=Terricaulis sp. TaxID=2768686 RepID=UPI002AC3D7BB|nr:hypothetical protein [Terricaulis sp.]MDZ4689889.1 hypothetical protein [Terricaulis sp.]
MRKWLLFLAGPLIWVIHFIAIYVIASIAALAHQTHDLWPRMAIGIVTAAALIAFIAALSLMRGDHERLEVFKRNVAMGGVVLGFVAVIWQTLPALAL